MKMFRLLTSIALFAIGAAGCGTQSPDFTPKLVSISITPNPIGTVPLGGTVQLTAHGTCTTPPGSVSTTQACDVSDATWSVDNHNVGSITQGGLFTAGPQQGTANITATSGGQTATLPVTVGPATVSSLQVTPSSATIGVGGSQTFKVQALYSDGQIRDVADPATITWSSSSTIVTVSPTSGATTTATSPATGTTGVATISATDGTHTGNATLTVSNAVLDGLVGVTPATDSVAVGLSKPFQLMGHYSDGTSKPVPNSSIDWTVSDATIATLTADPAGNQVLAKGVKKGGPVDVIATLKAGVSTSIVGANRSKKGQLTVVDAACTTPMVAPTYKTATAVDPLCLICTVDSPDNVINASPTDYAGLTSTIGLLMSTVNLTVTPSTAPGTQYPAGGEAAFIIGRPAGQIFSSQTPLSAVLSAEVLSQFTVTTLLNGAVQESSTSSATATLPPLLNLTLLGQLGSSDTALLHFTTTKPYDALRISFGTGVASLLTTTQVFAACATSTPPP